MPDRIDGMISTLKATSMQYTVPEAQDAAAIENINPCACASDSINCDFSYLPSHKIFVKLYEILDSDTDMTISSMSNAFGGHRKDGDYIKDIRDILFMTFYPLKPKQDLLDLCIFSNEVLTFVFNDYLSKSNQPWKCETEGLQLKQKVFQLKEKIISIINGNLKVPSAALFLFLFIVNIYLILLQELVNLFKNQEDEWLSELRTVPKICANHVLKIYSDLWKNRLQNISYFTVSKFIVDKKSLDDCVAKQEQIYTVWATIIDKCRSNDNEREMNIREIICSDSNLENTIKDLQIVANEYRDTYVKKCFKEFDWIMHFPIKASFIWIKLFWLPMVHSQVKVDNFLYVNTMCSKGVLGSSPAFGDSSAIWKANKNCQYSMSVSTPIHWHLLFPNYDDLEANVTIKVIMEQNITSACAKCIMHPLIKQEIDHSVWLIEIFLIPSEINLQKNQAA